MQIYDAEERLVSETAVHVRIAGVAQAISVQIRMAVRHDRAEILAVAGTITVGVRRAIRRVGRVGAAPGLVCVGHPVIVPIGVAHIAQAVPIQVGLIGVARVHAVVVRVASAVVVAVFGPAVGI